MDSLLLSHLSSGPNSPNFGGEWIRRQLLEGGVAQGRLNMNSLGESFVFNRFLILEVRHLSNISLLSYWLQWQKSM